MSSTCFTGSREQAREEARRLGFICLGFRPRGCGGAAGPGYRKPPPGRRKLDVGDCATHEEVARGICGEAPLYDKCTAECAKLMDSCRRSALPADTLPPTTIDPGVSLVQVTGEDEKGRRAAFDIVMVTQGISFTYKQVEPNMPASEMRRSIAAHFANATDIIATGTASSQGSRRTEEERAAQRAKKLGEFAADAAPTANVWQLNLGQNLVKCRDCGADATANQRPALLIGVAFREGPDVDLKQALKMAFTRRPDLPNLSEFSLFEFSRLR
jgi:hypothetical protein